VENEWLSRRRYRQEAAAFISWVNRGWPWPDPEMLDNIWHHRWVNGDETLSELYQEAMKFLFYVHK
jgi:hypothetical protein